MNYPKKILAFILALVMIITLLPMFQANAATKKMKLNKTKVTIYVGKTVKLKIKNNKSNKKVKWSSRNKKVATVTKKGKVKGKKAGKATIIAKVGNKKYKCKVTVKNIPSNKNEIPQENVGVNTTTESSSENRINETQAATLPNVTPTTGTPEVTAPLITEVPETTAPSTTAAPETTAPSTTAAPETTAPVEQTFITDTSLAKPFGLVVSNPDSGIIEVVWGKGDINCYNVYVNGVRKRTKVTAGVQKIPVQQEGTYQVSVATATPDGRESEWETMEIEVHGVAEPETTDYPIEQKPQIDTSIPKENGKMILQLNNKTNGQYDDNQIYWIIVGRDPQTHQMVYVDLDGNLINADSDSNDATLSSGRKYARKIVHTLAERHYVHLPAIESGRMYLSYGEPVYITFNEDANGNVGFAGPDVNNTSDANYNTLFEYLEFTTEAVNGSIRFHGNTTRVDFFSFPILTRLTDEYGGYDRCVGDTASRADTFNNFINTVSAPFKGLADDKRIMAPAKTLFREDGQYSNYFDDYINRFWTKYSSEDLIFDCEGGSFVGRVEGDRIKFTKSGDSRTFYVDKPSTQDVLEGRGAFNRGSSNDASQTSIELVIEAQLCAAFNRGIAMQPENWSKPSTYYKSGEICNEYAAFFHNYSVSNRAYGFCYDDVYDQSTLVECDNAAALTIDLKW